MAKGQIELAGEDILCSRPDGGAEIRLPYLASSGRLAAWASRYDAAASTDRDAELAKIGLEMFAWLDETGWASTWADGMGDRELEIRGRPSDHARDAVLLDAPWELLTRAGAPLALDPLQPLSIARRIGRPGTAIPPNYRDLRLMFMAAAAAGQAELDFEAEEAAILEATRGDGRLHVTVEETGTLEFLGGRLTSEEGPFEAVHLSCHGSIDPGLGPILLLETAEGEAARKSPGDVIEAMGANPPPLMVLSACRTAEAGVSSDAGTTRVTASFARQLTAQIANVVGWDGSVYDRDATDFARTFYCEVARGSTVPRATALARRALLKRHGEDPQYGRHWHLARVYLGPLGGFALSATAKPKRQNPGLSGERAFLDKERQRVPVATRAEFVGRRRSIQSILRAFRDGNGVLVHGMGALGKSSLAARVVSRTTCTPVVIFGRYDALAIFDEVLASLDPQIRNPERSIWRERIPNEPALLADALESWLSGSLDAKPILLIVDDLEQALATPGPNDTGVAVKAKADYRAPLGAVLEAFARAQTASRLLLTSRYDFCHPDGTGGDLAAGLVRVPLGPMPPRERAKQLRAAERLVGHEAGTADEPTQALKARALEAASGNPGLQTILVKPILAGELAAAETALEQIAAFRRTGVPPADIQALIDAGTAKDSANAVTAFFARLSFATYRAALTPDQARQLSAATLFADDVPIPRAALEAAGAALGVEDAPSGVGRLVALGLFDDWGPIDDVPHAAVNPLARPLAAPIEAADRPRLARAALPHLANAWRGRDGGFPADKRGCVAAEAALDGGAESAMLEEAAFAGAVWLERVEGQTRAALSLITRALATMPPGYAARAGFLRVGVECATLLGDGKLVDHLLAFLTRLSPANDQAAAVEHARLDLVRAQRLRTIGDIKAAEQLTRDARALFQATKEDRSAAIAAGQIAGILRNRGEFDEALRIRREEELPVYRRLGDVRSLAVTFGGIADILQDRGELDEALRIRREEELPIYSRLGDFRSLAMTMSQIGDILLARGDLDEALRIRREEVLPVFQRLGDVRSFAVTMGGVADILQVRGELDEALRIRREEMLPVFERLGDARERAVTMGKIADILQSRGELEEALRIRREVLQVFDRLGDVRSSAVAMGGIADILQMRSELDEALRIRREVLPVFDRLGDVQSLAVTMGGIADILQARGELDEALRIRREEQLPAFERLGDVRERAVTMGRIADILQARGELDEALRIRREEQLPVFARLGDLRLHALTMGKIADILQARGELDEALRIRREEMLPVVVRIGDERAHALTMGRIADILETRGDLDEALRIRSEEMLPVFVRLGDEREHALTMGRIADILEARGEFDEALRIRREEELPVYRRLGDARSLAVTAQQIGTGLIAAGGLEQGRIQEIYDALAEAFNIACEAGLANASPSIGLDLAQIMEIGGRRDEALGVLDTVDATLKELGDAAGLAHAAKLRETILARE